MTDGERLDRTAAAMRSALCDQKMLRFDAPQLIGVVPRAGRTIEWVERSGRHLHIGWDDEIVLHSHLRRHGAWYLHRTDDCWQHKHHELRALIEVPGWVAVCFNAALVETYRLPEATRHPGLGGLGPDLSRPDADLRRCVERLLRPDDPTTPLHDVLLDQRIFCRVGNVLRSEVLWACRLSPFAEVGDLTDHEAARLVDVAARLLRASLATAERRVAVYGRTAQPCLRCGESIETRPVGHQARVLYWCPGCQTRLHPELVGIPASVRRARGSSERE